jgi:hypothetical protein
MKQRIGIKPMTDTDNVAAITEWWDKEFGWDNEM